jgi:hypothetical protein
MCFMRGTNWCSISQRKALFIVTAVRTSNLTNNMVLHLTFAITYCQFYSYSIHRRGAGFGSLLLVYCTLQLSNVKFLRAKPLCQ